MNRLDANLQAVCPAVMATRFEPMTALAEDGHRFVVARDGLYVELRRSWLHALVSIAPSAHALPYGEVVTKIEIRLAERDLRCALAQFIADARLALPNEHACWLAVNAAGEVAYLPVRAISAGSGHIKYERPIPPDGFWLAVDLHSHGRLPAFWSETDDADDTLDDAKLAFVVGNLGCETPSIAARLVVPPGAQIDFSAWAESLL